MKITPGKAYILHTEPKSYMDFILIIPYEVHKKGEDITFKGWIFDLREEGSIVDDHTYLTLVKSSPIPIHLLKPYTPSEVKGDARAAIIKYMFLHFYK